MSFNLLDTVKGLFNSDLISKAASFLGENESGISKALSGIIPAIAGGIVHKASSGTNGATEILNSAKESHSSGIFSNLGGLLQGGNSDMLDKASGLLKGLLGDHAGGVTNAISGFSGIKASSANSLMSMAAPAALSSLGKHSVENNLNAGSLMQLLSSQKTAIMNALPAGLSGLAGLLGMGKISDAVSSLPGGAKKVMSSTSGYTQEKAAGGMKWLLPLLGLIVAGVLAWWFLLGGKNGCSSAKPVNKDSSALINNRDTANNVNITNIALGTVDSVTGNFIYNPGKMITIDLPNNGGKLEVGEFSTEAKLVAFLSDASKTIDTVKGNWFEFTNVRFKTGGSEITDESLTQLKNMVAIANAYPAAQFKIGGYTDNTGNPASNVALSQKRADAVAAMLKKSGVAEKSLVGTKGYGAEYPIGDNATAEGRAMNRRVAVNVKAK